MAIEMEGFLIIFYVWEYAAAASAAAAVAGTAAATAAAVRKFHLIS